MRTREEKLDGRAEALAWRIARFVEQRDTYGFKDTLRPGESYEEGVERTALGIYADLVSGRHEQVIGLVYDPDERCKVCRKESEKIVKEIKALQKKSS
jgi:hypothetical protein